ncbi:hypothetical protein WK78_26335 [Burkholderia cepacia]|uniref:hypothetical protein n=1 Tax=Burkholderia cepacia TaxID=292 RepID=UPI00076C3106|nr:hypothetical protein [Burkholderia cepacia]KVV20830.1 hypothetical protein WK78_26335 [Burkholderia cepacia]
MSETDTKIDDFDLYEASFSQLTADNVEVEEEMDLGQFDDAESVAQTDQPKVIEPANLPVPKLEATLPYIPHKEEHEELLETIDEEIEDYLGTLPLSESKVMRQALQAKGIYGNTPLEKQFLFQKNIKRGINELSHIESKIGQQLQEKTNALMGETKEEMLHMVRELDKDLVESSKRSNAYLGKHVGRMGDMLANYINTFDEKSKMLERIYMESLAHNNTRHKNVLAKIRRFFYNKLNSMEEQHKKNIEVLNMETRNKLIKPLRDDIEKLNGGLKSLANQIKRHNNMTLAKIAIACFGACAAWSVVKLILIKTFPFLIGM